MTGSLTSEDREALRAARDPAHPKPLDRFTKGRLRAARSALADGSDDAALVDAALRPARLPDVQP